MSVTKYRLAILVGVFVSLVAAVVALHIAARQFGQVGVGGQGLKPSDSKDIATDSDEDKAKANFENYLPLAAGVKRTTKIILYEGLPHPEWEPEALKAELEAKNTIKINGFPFYQELLPLKNGDRKELTRLFTSPDSFEPMRGGKLCGGYHPDYCVEWQDGKNTYRMLICLGCNEAYCFGPQRKLYCDIKDKARDQFAKILEAYRKNRPKKKDPFQILPGAKNETGKGP